MLDPDYIERDDDLDYLHDFRELEREVEHDDLDRIRDLEQNVIALRNQRDALKRTWKLVLMAQGMSEQTAEFFVQGVIDNA